MIKLFATPKPADTLPPVEYRNDPITEEQSFGREFNLIRMVDEYGNKRIDDIDKRMTVLYNEIKKLEKEREILCELTAVVFNHTKQKEIK